MIEHFKLQMEKNKSLTQEDIDFFIARRVSVGGDIDVAQITEYFQSKLGLKQLFYMLYSRKEKVIAVYSLFEDELDKLNSYKFEAMRDMFPKFVEV